MRVDMNVAVEEWEEIQGVSALRTGEMQKRMLNLVI